jgi:hypothetical protein
MARLPSAAWEVLTPITPQITFDDLTKEALVDPAALQAKYQNLTPAGFQDLLGTSIFFNYQPLTVMRAAPGLAWGLALDVMSNVEVLRNPVLPALHVEFHADAVMFATFAGKAGEYLDLGMTPKIIDRYGLDRVFSFGDLFAAGATLNLDQNPDFQQLKSGVPYVVPGVDLGAILHIPMWEGWDPRIGFSALNIGGYDTHQGVKGMEFGRRPTPFDPPIGGELPQINTIGFAVSPIYANIRYTVDLDIVDVTNTVLPGNDLALRSRLGLEIGIGARRDGTALFSVLAGLNALHSSFGALSRVWIFDVGFGHYVVEKGAKPGDDPDGRTVFIFGFRF